MEKTLKGLLKQLKLNESTVSTILGAAVVVVVGILLFNFFSKTQKKGEGQIGEEGVVTEEVKKEGQEGITPGGLPAVHKVEKGDDLWKIAEKYYGSGYNWVDIVKENKIRNPNKLFEGVELKIPAVAAKLLTKKAEVAGVTKETSSIEGDKYKVVKGDSLWDIAVRAYGDGYKWIQLAKENNLRNPNHIVPDQELRIPR
jgi:nucleoid-associated protein YgaU